jgi:hypothetical protein
MGVSIIILLPPNLLAQIWEVSWDLCRWHCAHKWCHGAVVEALTQHGMPPHPLQTYIYKVIDCGWEYGGVIMLYYQTCWPRFGKSIELCHLCAHNWCHGTVVIEALNPHGMAPTSTPNIYQKLEGDWQPSYAVDGSMDPSLCHYHHTCWPRFH